LAEIGEKAEVQVSEDEMQRALIEYVRGVPANQQREVFEFYRDNPGALANLRAPLFEEKVVDHLLTQIDVTDKSVSKEELLAEDEDEASAKPAKKAASKKKEAKAEAANDDGEAKKKPAPKKKAAAKKDDE
jgi:trigger factor